MKIFYAVQATGNGHIARAIELVPYLQQYGQVDIFLSGSNSNLHVPLPVKYKSSGVSLFYGNCGGLDYLKMLKNLSPLKTLATARDLPVENYDIVLNDFECITSLACKFKNIPSVNFGHQASFMSDHTPRPVKKDLIGECILKNYASANKYIGLHFEQYDDFIYSPIIKEKILKADPEDHGYITVYLSHYSDEFVIAKLKKISDLKFEVFSKKVTGKTVNGNVTLLPIDNDAFVKSMVHATGVITGAGFETPAEALVLGKKLMCLPIKGQYEQLCNAAALQKFNVPVLNTIDNNFANEVSNWMNAETATKLVTSHTTESIVSKVIETALSIRKEENIHNYTYAGYPSLNYE
jgi:uncharacterized protein (TIGR00661 family)